MIRIGLTNEQKNDCIKKYIKHNPNIREIIIFSDERFFMDIPDVELNVRQIGYKETIMYRTFYPLLEEIDESYLLVMNECMRTDKRNSLNYNCIAKYTNQTSHRLVFEWLPIISEEKDFMILLDFATSQKYKGQSIKEIDLGEEDVMCVPRRYSLTPITVTLPEDGTKLYEEEKEKLFKNLGNRHPDIIPRHLHVWTGKFKEPFIEKDKLYVARNSRFKTQNVVVYKNLEKGKQYILLDIQHRRLDFNDFLRKTEQSELKYLSTGLSIDQVYIESFNKWKRAVESFYAKTGIYQ